ncbi:hypothetical protein BGX26_008006, partial [Mortierella sp. AD094]
ETLANPPEDAYGGKYGTMTHTRVGDTLCVRWPAKNHAEKNEDNTIVQINLSKNVDGKDPTQQELLKNTIAELEYKNCGHATTTDRRPCGGCFQVPVRASGRYLLQWRWMLNPGEWYTSCASSTVAVVFLSAISVLNTQIPGTNAHSWMDCVNWQFKNPDNEAWGNNDGSCLGYARRFPKDKEFGSLDSAEPSRHYQQDHKNVNTALP